MHVCLQVHLALSSVSSVSCTHGILFERPGLCLDGCQDSLEEGDGDEHADGDRRTSADSQT